VGQVGAAQQFHLHGLIGLLMAPVLLRRWTDLPGVDASDFGES